MVCAGTEDDEQWLLNIEAWMDAVRGLGCVHKGFNDGLEDLWPKIEAKIGDAPFILTGHSRGAAQATILTGYALRSGKRPAFRVVFGEPLSGDGEFARRVAEVPSVSFCAIDGDEFDPVVSVPVDIPGILPYKRAAPVIGLHVSPSKTNPWPMPLSLHWIVDYQSALESWGGDCGGSSSCGDVCIEPAKVEDAH